MTYNDMTYAYGFDNVKHLGNKVLVFDPHYKTVAGYDVDSYNGYTPDVISNKVYTAFNNLPTDPNWNDIYDYLFGAPNDAPDFSKVV